MEKIEDKLKERITIRFKEKKEKINFNIFSKFFKVKNKSFLNESEICQATKICLEQFFKHSVGTDNDDEWGRFELFPQVKILYNLFVIGKCTNLDVDTNSYDIYLENGLIKYISKKVKNYKEVWTLIFESLSLKNTFVGLNIIANMIPNQKDIDKNIKGMIKATSELMKSQPILTEKIMQDKILQNAKEIIMEENIKSKKNKIG